MRRFQMREGGAVLRVIAVVLQLGGLFRWRHRAIDAYMFRCRTPLERVELVPLPPQAIRGVRKRELGRFGDDGSDFGRYLVGCHADWSAGGSSGFDTCAEVFAPEQGGADRGWGRGIEEASTMIRKLRTGEYRLYSRKANPKTGKRRNLRTFKSRATAEKHEREVQYFKRH